MDPLSQLQKEWIIINATRELLGIITSTPGSKYADAIKFAKDIYPALFKDSKTGIDRKDHYEKLYEGFRQEALAVSRVKEQETTPEKLIKKRLKLVESYLDQAKKGEDFDRLRKQLRELKVILSMAAPVGGLERVTENQAINNDAFKERANKVFVKNHLGKFVQYRNEENDTIFRVTVLHPNPSEGVIGADLIYEQYNEDEQKVRVVAIQYKIWNGDRVLYFSQSDNLENQLKKMSSFFCDKDFCKDCKGGNNLSKEKYRLSFCMAFLKPTDKLQDPKKLITSGYHLPICKVDKLKKKATKEYILSEMSIKNQSLKTSTFEELFDTEMIGSRWMDIAELESFYKQNKVLEPNERIILYAQGTLPID